MEELTVYLLKSGLCATVFYGIYWLFLKNETFYVFNRYFLLAGMICSIVLPLYKYSYHVNIEIPAGVQAPAAGAVETTHAAMTFSWWYAVIAVYGLVACIFVIRNITGLVKIRKVIARFGYSLLDGCKIVNVNIFKTSFSVFNYVFIDRSAETTAIEQKLIIQHEMAHVKQHHWADLLLAQFMCALQWFNPFAWLYLRAIKENHEFLADKAVLEQGNSPALYRAVLINHSLQVPVFQFASSFVQHDRFKRIEMMKKAGSHSIKKFTVLLVVPLFALLLMAFAKPVYVITYTRPQIDVKHQLPVLKTPVSVTDTAKKMVIVKPKRAILAVHKLTPKKEAVTNVLEKDSLNTPNRTVIITKVLNADPLYFLDGVEVAGIKGIDANILESVTVVKDKTAINKYGERGKNGVIEMVSKATASKKN